MSNVRACPDCDGPLPDDLLNGLCPRCMANVALTTPSGEAGPVAPEPASEGTIPVPASRSEGTKARYFGDYELLEEIAHGGMGVVYRARQVSLDRVVALKMALAGPFADPEFIKRFEVEAKAAAQLQHRNIVAIHEVGVHAGQHYYSMDYVDGFSLAALVQQKPLPPKQAARYLQIVAGAIHYAHQQRILHRDLKPANVLVDREDQPRVTDFGLAKRLDVDSGMESTGRTLGTLAYVPPEQVESKCGAVGPHSDVYSLGATLYHVLTGRPPFQGGMAAVLEQVRTSDPVSPRLLNASVPRDLETICLKCLEKDPPRRYHSAEALAEDLTNWLAGRPIRGRPPSRSRRVGCWVRRNPVGAALIVTLCLALILVLTLLKIVTDQRERIERDRDRTFAEGMARISLLWDDPDEVIISASDLAILANRSPGDVAEAVHGLYLGVRSKASPSDMAQRYARWLSQLQEQMSALLGQSVVFRMKLFKRFNQDEDSLAWGDADFMVLSAMDFLKARTRAPGVVPLARAKDVQEIVIFARAGSGVGQLSELAGKSIVFPDPDRAMTVFAKARLLAAGLHATDFRACTNLLDQVLEADETAVSYRDTILSRFFLEAGHGEADAGVTYRPLFERYRNKGLVLLDVFPATPNVLAGREGLNPRIVEAARKVIHSFETPARPEDLALGPPVQMVPVEDSYFDALRQAIRQAAQFEGQ